MIITLPLLSADELHTLRSLLVSAAWEDGRATAGGQAMLVKSNQQLSPQAPQLAHAQTLILRALERSPQFLTAALPARLFPPNFNRYADAANHYGPHVDSAVRTLSDGQRVRTDVSCTVFLSDAASYDGGELLVHEAGTRRQIKLDAGHAVLYPGDSVHEVVPVTRGERLASFFWIQSLVRSAEQRRLLYEMDLALMALRTHGENDATITLTGTYHNLLRMWSQP